MKLNVIVKGIHNPTSFKTEKPLKSILFPVGVASPFTSQSYRQEPGTTLAGGPIFGASVVGQEDYLTMSLRQKRTS